MVITAKVTEFSPRKIHLPVCKSRAARGHRGATHTSRRRPERRFRCSARAWGWHQGLWPWKRFLQQSLAAPWQPTLHVRKGLFVLIHF